MVSLFMKVPVKQKSSGHQRASQTGRDTHGQVYELQLPSLFIISAAGDVRDEYMNYNSHHHAIRSSQASSKPEPRMSKLIEGGKNHLRQLFQVNGYQRRW